MLNYNLLLTYLSEIGDGSWESFKDTCQKLSMNIGIADTNSGIASWNIAQRNLSRLGHVEFQFDGNPTWMVAPPSLINVPKENGEKAILCGTRNLSYVDLVRDSTKAMGLELKVYIQLEGPDAIIIDDCDYCQTHALADEIKAEWTSKAIDIMVAGLPSLNSMLEVCKKNEAPIGWHVEKFNVELLEWECKPDTVSDGFYRYIGLPWQATEYRLKEKGQFIKVPPFVGIYHFLRIVGRQTIFYDQRSKILSIKAATKMPELYERVATLCSGILPVFNPASSTDDFIDVPRRYANAIAAKLGQYFGE